MSAGKNAAPIVHITGVADEAIELISWVSIDETGKVTLFNHRSEMGQGTSQSIPQILAEELEVNFDDVHVRSVPANPKKIWPTTAGWKFFHKGLVSAIAAGRSYAQNRSVASSLLMTAPAKLPAATALATERIIDELSPQANTPSTVVFWV